MATRDKNFAFSFLFGMNAGGDLFVDENSKRDAETPQSGNRFFRMLSRGLSFEIPSVVRSAVAVSFFAAYLATALVA